MDTYYYNLFRDCFFLIVGGAMGLVALAVAGESVWRLFRRDKAVGEIVGFKRSGRYSFPRFAFHLPSGECVEVTSGLGQGTRSYKRGDSVRVLYNPHSPGQAEIRSFCSLWLFPTAMTALATPFIWSSLANLL